MKVEARTLGEPLPDDRRLVRTVVIQDEMYVQVTWNFGVDRIGGIAGTPPTDGADETD
jgi:hypothetical protein